MRGADTSGLFVGRGVVHGVLHRGDFFCVFVRNFDAEFVFKRHYQLHSVERVGTQIGDEGLFVGDLGLFNAELLGNDLSDSLLDVVHGCRSFKS